MKNSSQKIPSIIKPFVFARGNAHFVGEFDLYSLPRVMEQVAKSSTAYLDICFSLEENKIRATGRLKFDACMACVNCLEELVYHCDTKLNLVFTSTPDDENEDLECVEIVDSFTEFDTREFVAEEVLLNLPMFIKHDYDCIKLDDALNGESVETQKPFAHLKDFIQKG